MSNKLKLQVEDEEGRKQKGRIVRFIDIYRRKFWHIARLNLMFLVFNLPITIATLFVFIYVLNIENLKLPTNLELGFKIIMASFYLCIPILTVGPVQAGFTYVLRNYAREEHAWLWADFKEKALENIKEGIVISLVGITCMAFIIADINALSLLAKDNIILSTISGIFLGIFILFFTMVHMYIYPMLVTFKLGIRQLYKNSLIFSFINFLPNLVIIAVCFGFIAVSFIVFKPVIGFVIFVFLTPATIGLITNYFVYPYLKKYLIDN